MEQIICCRKRSGGIPNSSEDIKQAHAAAIEMYIQDHVGMKARWNIWFGDYILTNY